MARKKRSKDRGGAPTPAVRVVPGQAVDRRGRTAHALWAGGLFLVAWLLGLLALQNGLASDDSGEYIAAAFTLGLGHMPGYAWHPLFTGPLLRLPWTEPGFGVAAGSLLFFPAAVTLAFFWFAGQRTALEKGLLAAGLLALLCCERMVFYQMNIDVYGGTFLMGVLLLAAFWTNTAVTRRLLLPLVALAVLTHPSAGVFALLVAGLGWTRRGGAVPVARLLAAGVFTAVAFTALEWYLPLRSASGVWFQWGDATTPGAYLAYKTTGPSLQTALPTGVPAHVLRGLRDLGAMGGVLLGAGAAACLLAGGMDKKWWRWAGVLGPVLAGVYLVLIAVALRMPDTPFGLLTYTQFYGPVAALAVVWWLVARPPPWLAVAALVAMAPFVKGGVDAAARARATQWVPVRLVDRLVAPVPPGSVFLTHLTSHHFALLYEHGVKQRRADVAVRDVMGRIWEGGVNETLRRRMGSEGVLAARIREMWRRMERDFVAANLQWTAMGGRLDPDMGQAQLLQGTKEVAVPWGSVWLSPPPAPGWTAPDMDALTGETWPDLATFGRDDLGAESVGYYLATLAALTEDEATRQLLAARADLLGDRSPMVLAMLGQMAVRDRQEHLARRRLARAFALDPGETANRVELARLEYLTGRYEEALALLSEDRERVLAFPGGEGLLGAVHLRVADQLMLAGDYGAALAGYEAALALLPDLPEADLRMGEALQRTGASLKAVKALGRAVKGFEQRREAREKGQKMDDGLYADALGRLGQAYVDVGQYQEALTVLEKLRELRPADDTLLLGMARLAEDRLQDRQKALGYYRLLVDVAPDFNIRAFARQKAQALEQGRDAGTIRLKKSTPLDLLRDGEP